IVPESVACRRIPRCAVRFITGRRVCYHCALRVGQTLTIREKRMRLVRYGRRQEPAALARMGVLVTSELVADLRAGYALYRVEEVENPKGRDVAAIYMPPYIAQFLHVGEPAWLALADAYTYLTSLVRTAPDAEGLRGEPIFMPLAEC